MNDSTNTALQKALAMFLAAPVRYWDRVFPGKMEERGRESFQKGEVSGLRAPGETHLTADVGGSPSHSPDLILEQERLASRCQCAEHEEWGTCRHVSALGIAVRESGGQSLATVPPVVELQVMPPKELPKEFYLQPGEYDNLCLYASSSTAPEILEKCGFTGATLGEDSMLRQESDFHEEVTWLRARVKAAAASGYKIKFRPKSDGRETTLTGVFLRKPVNFLFKACEGKATVQMDRACSVDNRNVCAVLHEMTSKGVLLESGDVVHVDPASERERTNHLGGFFNPELNPVGNLKVPGFPGHLMPSYEFNRGSRHVALEPSACAQIFTGSWVAAHGDEMPVESSSVFTASPATSRSASRRRRPSTRKSCWPIAPVRRC